MVDNKADVLAALRDQAHESNGHRWVRVDPGREFEGVKYLALNSAEALVRDATWLSWDNDWLAVISGGNLWKFKI